MDTIYIYQSPKMEKAVAALRRLKPQFGQLNLENLVDALSLLPEDVRRRVHATSCRDSVDIRIDRLFEYYVDELAEGRTEALEDLAAALNRLGKNRLADSMRGECLPFALMGHSACGPRQRSCDLAATMRVVLRRPARCLAQVWGIGRECQNKTNVFTVPAGGSRPSLLASWRAWPKLSFEAATAAAGYSMPLQLRLGDTLYDSPRALAASLDPPVLSWADQLAAVNLVTQVWRGVLFELGTTFSQSSHRALARS